MENILKDLNPEQKKAVTYPSGPLLIVAGAGTGKTTVITRRIAWLVLEKGVKPEEILALTFTNKAAEEMEERVDKILPYGYVDLWVLTFHNFAQRVLEERGLDIGLSPQAELLDDTAQWLFVRQNLDKFNLDYYQPVGTPTKFIRALLTHFSRLKDEDITPEQYLEYAEGLSLNQDNAEAGGQSHRSATPPPTPSSKRRGHLLGISSQRAGDLFRQSPPFQGGDNQNRQSPPFQGGDKGVVEELEIKRVNEVAEAYHTYQKLLRDNNKMDFGDLINYVLKLFRERPNVLAEFRRRFKYILVDEFQDTNWAQYELVKMLSAPVNNLTVVADDDQSIYRFRGASMSNVIMFGQDYPQTGKTALTANYRSGQEILDLSYDFIQLNNPNRLEAREHFQLVKKLKSQTRVKSFITHLAAATGQIEAKIVAETILEIKNKDKDATWNDFAILTRANSHTKNFEDALARAKIPFWNLSGESLYDAPLVMDIICWLRVLGNHNDGRSLFRLLNLPYLKLAAEDIVKLTHYAGRKQIPLYEVVRNPQIAGVSDKESLRNLGKIFSEINQHREESKTSKPSVLILNWLEKGGYFEYLKNLADEISARHFRVLNGFWHRLRDLEEVIKDPRLPDIMEVLEMELASGEEGDLAPDFDLGPEMARIMTAHSAKGKEFKYVFIANLVDKRFPSISRKEQIPIPDELVKEVVGEGDSHLEEERRLFYVAMTRAKTGLFFTSAEHYNGTTSKKLSRFLYELQEVNPAFKISQEVLGREHEQIFSSKQNIYQPSTNKLITNKLALPVRFSFTQLKDFATCPLLYKMKYILKVPLPGKHFFSYGTSLHSTLQRFLQMLSQKARAVQTDLFGGIASSLQPSPQPSPLKGEGEREKTPSPARGEGTGEAGDGRGLPVSLDELLSLYEQSWIDDWYESPEQKQKYFKLGKEALKKFYQDLVGNVPQVKALERSFNLKIGEYTLVGKIDRVDYAFTTPARLAYGEAVAGGPTPPQRGGDNTNDIPSSKRRGFESNPLLSKEGAGGGLVRIIDYKTGNPKDKLSLDDKEQLLIYQIASEEVFREKVDELSYYYLDDGSKQSFVGNEQEKEAIKKKVITIIEQIKTSDFAPNPQFHFCDFCQFKTNR